MVKTQFDADILLIGGGLVGLTCALALGISGLRVSVLDAAPPAISLAPEFDGRVSALGRASTRLLAALGVWPRLADQAQPINDILVSDGRIGRGPSPLSLHFDHLEGDGEIAGQPLGHIVENRHLRAALVAALGDHAEMVSLRAASLVTGYAPDPGGVTVRLADGGHVRGRLCVAADGRESPLRQMAGLKTIGWDYGQSGIVATVHHDLPHGGLAHEYFLPGGPFAILPMTGNRSSLVWTEPTARAQALRRLDQADFDIELRARFGSQWGEIKSEGPRWIYPLSFHHARDYVADRLALAGDAAHTIHPIAGQGLNLGLRDVAALAEVLVDAHRLGLDIGSAIVLARYQAWRRFDNVSLSVITDLLNRLFSNDLPLLRLARTIGLGVAGSIGPLRRMAMRHAAGDAGTLPRLLNGDPLT
ncbi:MAG TPA: FAD-dependent monooxygenase [Alphaproteobacteria bacterium]|nr:FAD-dependent monooxygenase [Alphaproteobacteria bacterium]